MMWVKSEVIDLCRFQRYIGIIHWNTKERVTTCHSNISHSGWDEIKGGELWVTINFRVFLLYWSIPSP